MDNPYQPTRSVADLKTRVSELQQKVIVSLDELEVAVIALDSPDSIRHHIKKLRDLLTRLWLSNAAVLLLMEEKKTQEARLDEETHLI